MLTKKRKNVLWAIGLLIAALFVVLIVFTDNRTIDFETFEIEPSNGTAETAVKIAHLSDLHFPKIKVDLGELTGRLAEESVRFIAVTGIDGSADVHSCGVFPFMERLAAVAPIVYVNGNHEAAHKDAARLYARLESMGVTVLENESVNFAVGKERITFVGLTDDALYGPDCYRGNAETGENTTILLAHRPEKWPDYTSSANAIQPDLILSGHAHGGQIRFFGTGLFAPNQGFFPEYDAGLYRTENEKTTMLVSRGIGNSLIPFRFNNKPHVPIVTIRI